MTADVAFPAIFDYQRPAEMPAWQTSQNSGICHLSSADIRCTKLGLEKDSSFARTGGRYANRREATGDRRGTPQVWRLRCLLAAETLALWLG